MSSNTNINIDQIHFVLSAASFCCVLFVIIHLCVKYYPQHIHGNSNDDSGHEISETTTNNEFDTSTNQSNQTYQTLNLRLECTPSTAQPPIYSHLTISQNSKLQQTKSFRSNKKDTFLVKSFGSIFIALSLTLLFNILQYLLPNQYFLCKVSSFFHTFCSIASFLFVWNMCVTVTRTINNLTPPFNDSWFCCILLWLFSIAISSVIWVLVAYGTIDAHICWIIHAGHQTETILGFTIFYVFFAVSCLSLCIMVIWLIYIKYKQQQSHLTWFINLIICFISIFLLHWGFAMIKFSTNATGYSLFVSDEIELLIYVITVDLYGFSTSCVYIAFMLKKFNYSWSECTSFSYVSQLFGAEDNDMASNEHVDYSHPEDFLHSHRASEEQDIVLDL